MRLLETLGQAVQADSSPVKTPQEKTHFADEGHFPKNSCTRLRIFSTVHSRVVLPALALEILVEEAVDVLIGSHTAVDFPDRGFFFQNGVCDRNVTLKGFLITWCRVGTQR